jgi:hypothetical protein
MDTPSWAARHNYFWHSNPRSKDRAKAYFDKAIIRPRLKKAWAIYEDESKSIDERTDAWATIAAFDQRHNGGDNANMQAGRLVQWATDAILLDKKDPAKIYEDALERFSQYVPRDWDDGTDKAKTEQYKTEVVDVIRNAQEGLREAMSGDDQYIGEEELLHVFDGLSLPHNTKPDYARCGDLKTKWSSLSQGKFRNGRLPNNLSGQFEMNNVFQIAGFWACNGGMPPWLLYVNKDDYRLFTPQNSPELRDDFLRECVAQIKIYHRTTENHLRAANSTEELLGLVSPNFDSLSWKEPPQVVMEAKKHWVLK